MAPCDIHPTYISPSGLPAIMLAAQYRRLMGPLLVISCLLIMLASAQAAAAKAPPSIEGVWTEVYDGDHYMAVCVGTK